MLRSVIHRRNVTFLFFYKRLSLWIKKENGYTEGHNDSGRNRILTSVKKHHSSYLKNKKENHSLITPI